MNKLKAIFSKQNKKIFLSATSFIISLFSFVSISFSGKFFPNNKINSIVSYSEKLSKESKENINGFISLYRLVDSVYDYNIGINQEATKELNSLFPEINLINAYPRHLRNNLFSPISYSSTSGIQKDVSVLLVPQEIDDGSFEFRLTIPLLTKELTRQEKQYPGSSDMFVNQDFADMILSSSGYNSYDQIIDLSLDVFSKENGSNTCSPITIKGVIDSKSDFYSKYSSIFGDFFISFNHYSLNQMPVSYFELSSDKSLNQEFLKTVDRIYKYQTKVRSYTNSYKSYLYEYRISLFSNSETTESNLLMLANKDNDQHNECFNIYNAFVDNINLLYMIIFLAISLTMFVGVLLLTKYLKKDENNQNKKLINLVIIGSSLMALPLSLIISPPLSKALKIGLYLSSSNYITTIALFILCIILALYCYLPRKSNSNF